MRWRRTKDIYLKDYVSMDSESCMKNVQVGVNHAGGIHELSKCGATRAFQQKTLHAEFPARLQQAACGGGVAGWQLRLLSHAHSLRPMGSQLDYES
jgi:hypothetical protein